VHSPSRERVLGEVEAHGPLSIAQIVAATGLHENTVRGHLHRLAQDGYVRQGTAAPTGRGRPTGSWSAVDPEAASPYVGLAVALADALTDALGDTSEAAPAQAREAGRGWGMRLAADHPHQDPRALVVDIMREQGFAPQDDGDVVALHQCPLLVAASRRAPVVCAVHEGMIEGIVRSQTPDARVTLAPFALDGACGLHVRAAS